LVVALELEVATGADNCGFEGILITTSKQINKHTRGIFDLVMIPSQTKTMQTLIKLTIESLIKQIHPQLYEIVTGDKARGYHLYY